MPRKQPRGSCAVSVRAAVNEHAGAIGRDPVTALAVDDRASAIELGRRVSAVGAPAPHTPRSPQVPRCFVYDEGNAAWDPSSLGVWFQRAGWALIGATSSVSRS